jgi:protein-S-isoprenylcysteine O-methyltransferase Ste14
LIALVYINIVCEGDYPGLDFRDPTALPLGYDPQGRALMREIFIGAILGLLFFAGSASLSALAIKHATSSVWTGVAGMVVSIATLVLFIFGQQTGKSIWIPALLATLSE